MDLMPTSFLYPILKNVKKRRILKIIKCKRLEYMIRAFIDLLAIFIFRIYHKKVFEEKPPIEWFSLKSMLISFQFSLLIGDTDLCKALSLNCYTIHLLHPIFRIRQYNLLLLTDSPCIEATNVKRK